MNNSNLQPLLLDTNQTAKLLGISTRHFYSMLSSGRIAPMPVEFGAKKLWRFDELQYWVSAGCPNRERWVEHKENQG